MFLHNAMLKQKSLAVGTEETKDVGYFHGSDELASLESMNYL